MVSIMMAYTSTINLSTLCNEEANPPFENILLALE